MKRIVVPLSCLFLFFCTSRQELSGTSSGCFMPSHIHVKGGAGESFDNAAIITGAKTHDEGMAAEHAFLCQLLGKPNKEWRVVSQSLAKEKRQSYDIVEIELLPSHDRRIYYFDVSAFSWIPK